jgi:hypothetical protein
MLPNTGGAADVHAMPLSAAMLLVAVRYILFETGRRWMAIDQSIGMVTLPSDLVHVTRT